MPVNAAQQMIGGDVVIEAEVVKQLGRCRLNAHHRYPSRIRRGSESRRDSDDSQSLTFSTVFALSRRFVSTLDELREPPQGGAIPAIRQAANR
jgi:hypothetical protein